MTKGEKVAVPADTEARHIAGIIGALTYLSKVSAQLENPFPNLK